LLYTKFDNNISFLTLVIVRKPFFYFLLTVTLTPGGPNTIPTQVFILACYTPSLITVSHSYVKLLSGNHFSIFRNGDLDLDPRGPKCNTNQGLHISLLYAKFDNNISFLPLVIVRKPFFYF
jgi:hypothetical protein